MKEIEPPESHDDLDGVPPPSAMLRLRGRAGAWNELAAAFDSGRMHHAWLMQGPQGIGKATTAFAFSRLVLGGASVLSPSAGGDPVFDPAHPAVRQIAQGSHPNLIHLSRPPVDRGEGFKTQITVDEIRRLNRFFQATAGGGWRVAIVDPADDLNRSAANALLKTLEEPPARSLFLITNHVPGRLLPTIRSRCRVLRFEPLADAVVAEELAAMQPEAGLAERNAAVALASGNLRDGLLMLTNGGLEIEAQASRLFAAATPDWGAIQSAADALTQKGREAAWALLCDALLAKVSAEALGLTQRGDRHGAEVMARLWQAEAARWREAAAFNLDRKQMVLTFFARLQAARAQLAR